jgi:hypothetical protein
MGLWRISEKENHSGASQRRSDIRSVPRAGCEEATVHVQGLPVDERAGMRGEEHAEPDQLGREAGTAHRYAVQIHHLWSSLLQMVEAKGVTMNPGAMQSARIA